MHNRCKELYTRCDERKLKLYSETLEKDNKTTQIWKKLGVLLNVFFDGLVQQLLHHAILLKILHNLKHNRILFFCIRVYQNLPESSPKQ